MGGRFSIKGIRTMAKSTTTTGDASRHVRPPGVGTKLERHSLSEMPRCRRTEADRLALGLYIKSHEQINDIILRRAGARRLGMPGVLLAAGHHSKFREYKGADSAGIAFGANALRRKLSSVQKASSARSTSSTRRTTSRRPRGCRQAGVRQPDSASTNWCS